jgi:hypothetical protein
MVGMGVAASSEREGIPARKIKPSKMSNRIIRFPWKAQKCLDNNASSEYIIRVFYWGFWKW